MIKEIHTSYLHDIVSEMRFNGVDQRLVPCAPNREHWGYDTYVWVDVDCNGNDISVVVR